MGQKQIFIVDDEPDIRTLYTVMFSRMGYDVHSAGSAEEALKLLQNGDYRVMFLDLDLPGMDGIELCRKIHDTWPMAIPYAVTGYASRFDITECQHAGFEDYFTKPVNLLSLLDAAEHAFDKLAQINRQAGPVRVYL